MEFGAGRYPLLWPLMSEEAPASGSTVRLELCVLLLACLIYVAILSFLLKGQQKILELSLIPKDPSQHVLNLEKKDPFSFDLIIKNSSTKVFDGGLDLLVLLDQGDIAIETPSKPKFGASISLEKKQWKLDARVLEHLKLSPGESMTMSLVLNQGDFFSSICPYSFNKDGTPIIVATPIEQVIPPGDYHLYANLMIDQPRDERFYTDGPYDIYSKPVTLTIIADK